MVRGASSRTTFAAVPQDNRIKPRFSACANTAAVDKGKMTKAA